MRGFVIGLVLGVAGGVGASFSLLPALAPERGAAPQSPDAAASADTPPPAYLVVLGEVKDSAAFGPGYAAKLPPLYARFGGEYLAIGKGVEVLEGDYRPPSYVIARWPSKEAALAFWNSDQYEALRRARIAGGWGDFDVLLVEGLAEPARAAPGVGPAVK